MTLLLRIAERVLNRPLLVHPDKVPFILGVLEGRIPLGDISSLREIAEAHVAQLPEDAQLTMRGPLPQSSRFVGDRYETDAAGKPVARLPYQRTSDGTAIVTVTGSLINRGAFVGSSSGETSYEGIKFQLASAVADPKVSSIILDIESPGGEAVGAFEAADAVRAANAQKPVTAVVNGMAASAAYALASGAGRIITTPTGVVGSIGVVLLHADFSRMLDKEGISPTLIFAGSHKVDGNPFEPLPESVRADMQREVNGFYDLFIQTVAQGRKSMSPAAIRGTEARVFIGQDAVDAGLADSLGTFESTLADISASTARNRAQPGGRRMSNESNQPVVTGISKADHDAAVAAATTAGTIAGRKAAHDRFAAILADDKIKGKGKETTALDLALKSPDMAAADVVAFVASLPATSAQPAANAKPNINQRMNGQGADLALGGPLGQRSGGDEAQAKNEKSLNPSSVYAGRRKASA